ncbi:MAG: ankyrin repeat domain-containing protein [Bdellovibrionaceae bacterium]|nr:ankyrin repeat domain-containing protein [Pseudobdellovibrionaceae bacterium]
MTGGDWKDFYGACIAGNFPVVRYHIDHGMNPNYQHPEFEVTALVTAILNGHSEIALYLLENGADPRLRSDFDQLTPEQASLRREDTAVLSALRDRGALTWRSWLWRLKGPRAG